MNSPGKMRRIGLVLLILLWLTGVCAACGRTYSLVQLRVARQKGVYPNPVAGMQALIAQGYRGVQKVEIEYSGTNSFQGRQPHVWFVIAKVWAEGRADGSRLHERGYDFPGVFFLRVREGWVHVSEGAFPMVIGFFMDLFGLEGR